MGSVGSWHAADQGTDRSHDRIQGNTSETAKAAHGQATGDWGPVRGGGGGLGFHDASLDVFSVFSGSMFDDLVSSDWSCCLSVLCLFSVDPDLAVEHKT